MTLQEQSRSPRFVSPKWMLVKCKEIKELHGSESGCIIATEGGDELVIVPTQDVEGEFVRGVRIGTDPSDESLLLVDMPNGDRILVSKELTRSRDGSSL